MNFEVNRQDFLRTRTVESGASELESGQVRLVVERFAVTTNNITYAVAGDMLDYWGFFPTEAPWGRLPVMGLGTVAESAHPQITEGGRYFGFYPMAVEHIITAEVNSSGFKDIGVHRANHAGTYTDFRNVETDVMFRAGKPDEYLLLWGLFMTSFLIDDNLADSGSDSDPGGGGSTDGGAPFRGAAQTLITSASSKTSISLAHCLASRDNQKSIGLTSDRNRTFVESLELYDKVITYDEIEQLDRAIPSVVVDMAGSSPVRTSIHSHFGDNLKASMLVGITHREDQGGGAVLPGPEPEFFFAPAQSAKRSKDWGPKELATRIAGAFHALLDDSERWLTVEQYTGVDGMEFVYRKLQGGQADPAVGYIVSPSGDLHG